MWMVQFLAENQKKTDESEGLEEPRQEPDSGLPLEDDIPW